MATKVSEKSTGRGKPKGKGRRNPKGALVALAAPLGAGFIEGALEQKLGFYGKLAPEAKAILLLLLGWFAMKRNKPALGGALLALAGRYGAARIFGGGTTQGLADASDRELEEVAERYGLGDLDDELGALPGDEELGAFPGDEELGEVYDAELVA